MLSRWRAQLRSAAGCPAESGWRAQLRSYAGAARVSALIVLLALIGGLPLWVAAWLAASLASGFGLGLVPRSRAFLPRNLAGPLVRAAKRVGRRPILDYTDCVLYNWACACPHCAAQPHSLPVARKDAPTDIHTHKPTDARIAADEPPEPDRNAHRTVATAAPSAETGRGEPERGEPERGEGERGAAESNDPLWEIRPRGFLPSRRPLGAYPGDQRLRGGAEVDALLRDLPRLNVAGTVCERLDRDLPELSDADVDALMSGSERAAEHTHTAFAYLASSYVKRQHEVDRAIYQAWGTLLRPALAPLLVLAILGLICLREQSAAGLVVLMLALFAYIKIAVTRTDYEQNRAPLLAALAGRPTYRLQMRSKAPDSAPEVAPHAPTQSAAATPHAPTQAAAAPPQGNTEGAAPVAIAKAFAGPATPMVDSKSPATLGHASLDAIAATSAAAGEAAISKPDASALAFSAAMSPACRYHASEEALFRPENAELVQPYRFTELADERWFFVLHACIEFAGRLAVGAVQGLSEEILGSAPSPAGRASVKQKLGTIREALEQAGPMLSQMHNRLRPDVFFYRLRPFFSVLAADGANPIFEGVPASDTPGLRGATGAQSALLPLVDGIMGLEHKDHELRKIMQEFHASMPPKHRALLTTVRERHVKPNPPIGSSASPEDIAGEKADAELAQLPLSGQIATTPAAVPSAGKGGDTTAKGGATRDAQGCGTSAKDCAAPDGRENRRGAGRGTLRRLIESARLPVDSVGSPGQRAGVEGGDALTVAHDAVIDAMVRFREWHKGLTRAFIVSPSSQKPSALPGDGESVRRVMSCVFAPSFKLASTTGVAGSGGTDFNSYLKTHLDDTMQKRIEPGGPH